MHIAIAGGGKVGYYLAKTLMDNHRITLIEKDEALCGRLAEDLGITVVAGDVLKLQVLEDARISRCDVFVAATGNDEVNLISSQIVKHHFQIAKVIARVNNPRNEQVFKVMDIPLTVSSTTVITRLIEQEVSIEDIRTLLTFERGNLAVIEIDLAADAPAVGKTVATIAPNLPRECILMAVVREPEIIIPRGDTMLSVEDRVLAITTLDTIALLKTALTGH
ncbi:MAG: TrkA family potassium uptake protein [Firmicutes bacterium]|nr:TrkA family potassium uptake protein [Bacillota bacterium]